MTKKEYKERMHKEALDMLRNHPELCGPVDKVYPFPREIDNHYEEKPDKSGRRDES